MLLQAKFRERNLNEKKDDHLLTARAVLLRLNKKA